MRIWSDPQVELFRYCKWKKKKKLQMPLRIPLTFFHVYITHAVWAFYFLFFGGSAPKVVLLLTYFPEECLRPVAKYYKWQQPPKFGKLRKVFIFASLLSLKFRKPEPKACELTLDLEYLVISQHIRIQKQVLRMCLLLFLLTY